MSRMWRGSPKVREDMMLISQMHSFIQKKIMINDFRRWLGQHFLNGLHPSCWNINATFGLPYNPRSVVPDHSALRLRVINLLGTTGIRYLIHCVLFIFFDVLNIFVIHNKSINIFFFSVDNIQVRVAPEERRLYIDCDVEVRVFFGGERAYQAVERVLANALRWNPKKK